MIDSREKRIKENIGLVHSCAKKMLGRGVEYDDLFQAGCIGLIKAIDGFDETKGFALSTYAVPVILGEIKRIFRDDGTISVSRTLKERGLKINRERDKFVKKNNREPTVQEISEIIGINECEVAQAITATMPVLSLTGYYDENDEQIDIPVESHENRISTLIALDETINQLDYIDKKIIYERYYFNKTQTEVAAELGITQVQVSRKEKRILKQMRTKLL